MRGRVLRLGAASESVFAMYRTPMRRGLSPDTPPLRRSPSPARRGRSPSPARRGRSPSPARRGRSPSPARRGRSRSRSHGRSRSRPAAQHRSKSRARRSRSRSRRSPSKSRRTRSRSRSRRTRSRSRTRRSRSRVRRSRSRGRQSPSPRRRRSSSSSSSSNSPPPRQLIRSEQVHYSSSYSSGAVSSQHLGSNPLPNPGNDRSASGLETVSSIYQSSFDARTLPGYPSSFPERKPIDEPLPMPKKSILKRRHEPDVRGLSPQVNNSSNKDLADLKAYVAPARSSELASNSATKILDQTQTNSNHMTRGNNMSALVMGNQPLAGMNYNIPSPLTPTGRTLTPEKQPDMLPSACPAGKTAPHDLAESKLPSVAEPKVSQYSSMGNFLHMFNKNACESQGMLYNPTRTFPESAEGAQKPDKGDSFLLPHEQMKNEESKLSSITVTADVTCNLLDQKQRSASEIEDEERFLYGDEDKNVVSEKTSPIQTPPASHQTPPASHQTPPASQTAPEKQEFEKIHDLLKTIGLDIGVAEIGKLAVRTQERLHGKKLIPKTSPASTEPPQSTAKASPADPIRKVPEPPSNLEKSKDPVRPPPNAETDTKAVQPVKEQTPPVPQPEPTPEVQSSVPKKQTRPPDRVRKPLQQNPVSTVPEPSPSPVPMYAPYHPANVAPAYSMPPPNYNPYAPYMQYPASSWPMYTPAPPPPKVTPIRNTRSNLLVIDTTNKPEGQPPTTAAEELVQKDDDLGNTEVEKMKVMEELEELKKEHKVKNKNLQALSAKVEQLRAHQSILLRKKRRTKEDHKDPLFEELTAVLASAWNQITTLCKEMSDMKQKQQQLTKVAEILGASPAELAEKSDKTRKREKSPASPHSPVSSRAKERESRSSIESRITTDPSPKSSSNPSADNKSASSSSTPPNSGSQPKDPSTPNQKSVSTQPKDPSAPNLSCSSKTEDVLPSRDKSRSRSPKPSTPSSKVSPSSETTPTFELSEVFEYYDSGAHWCEECNTVFMALSEFLLHLHDKKHGRCLKEEKRPWAKKKPENTVRKQKLNVPLKGPEFLIPTYGFYCQLCEELLPDPKCAEEHLKAYIHNDKYKKHTDVVTDYEGLRRERKRKALEAAHKEAELKRKSEQKSEAHEESKAKKAKREEREEERNSRRKTRSSVSPAKSEPKSETHDESKAKKAKREEREEERNGRRKTRSSVSPAKSEPKRSTTPDKEPAKTSTFGTFVWKNKSKKISSTSRAETATNKEKEDEDKGPSVKPKGIEIILMGKPSNPQGSPRKSTSSSTEPPSPTHSSSSSNSTTTTQTKVRPDLPNLVGARKIPSLAVNQPIPLNTFLSIQSSSSTSKSILKGKSGSLVSEDMFSNAFEGQSLPLMETKLSKPETTSACKTKVETSSGTKQDVQKTVSQNTKESQKDRTQGPYDMLFNKNVKVEPASQNTAHKGVKDVKESPTSSSRKTSFTSSSQSSVLPAQKAARRFTQSPDPGKTQQVAARPSNAASVRTSLTANTTSGKSDLPKALTGKPGFSHSQEQKGKVISGQKLSEIRTPSKADKASSKEPINTVTSKLVTVAAQKSKNEKETVALKQPESSSVHSIKPAPVSASKPNPSYSATVKLNQKFKKAPLSLPPSLFGHKPDLGSKDIKISSSAGAYYSSYKAEEPTKAPEHRSTSAANKDDLQHELDSYYKLIDSEENSEDLTTSEDQDIEAPHVISSAPIQLPLQTPTLNIQVASKQPDAAMVPDEDLDECDMACEVPVVPTSPVIVSQHKTIGKSPLQFSSATLLGTMPKQLLKIPLDKTNVHKDKSNKVPEATTAPDYSMEDLSVLTTCDSD